MPRTKYSRKTRQTNESLNECDMRVKTFERHVQQRVAKLERDAQADIKGFEAYIDVIVSRLPPEIRQMTLGELLKWGNDNQKEDCNEDDTSIKNRMQPPIIPKLKTDKSTKCSTATSDDGYVTETGTSGGRMSRTGKTYIQISTTRKTRSSTRANKAKLEEINQKSVTKPKWNCMNESSLKTANFKTPALLKPFTNAYDVVTPKIKPDAPLNVLRRPRQGEMVLSMQGSPLLVSAVVEEKTANINVPLANGNVMSLLPQEGLRMSHIPALDPETMHQLETLKNHIEKVIALK